MTTRSHNSTGRRSAPASTQASPKKAAPPPGSLLLSAAEYERIKASAEFVGANTMTAAQRKAAEKQRLYEESKAQVAQWTNTIAGQREAKLKAKAQREAEAEERARQIDEEEARFQAEEKQRIIERAKMAQYMQNDRVKQINTALLTAETLQVREKQLGGKGRREEMQRQQEAQRVAAEEEERQEAIRRELEKQKQARLDALMLAEGQLQQAAQRRQERRNQRDDYKVESELLEMDIQQFKAEEAMRASMRKNMAKQMTSDFQRQMEDVDARKRAEEEAARAEEERIRTNAAELQRKNEARRQEERARLEQMEKHRERTRQSITSVQAAKETKEEEIRRKAEEAQVKKEQEVAEAKERARRARLEEIAQHRAEEEKRKAHERYSEMAKEHELLQAIESDVRSYNSEIKDRKQARLRTIKDVQKDYVASMGSKEEARKREREEEIHHRIAMENNLAAQDDMFRKFADAKLAEAEALNLSGHAHILNKVVARNDTTIRKPAEPTGHPVLVDTHRRLGFNWDD